ncbi:NADH-quinone oxidoreductase subunit A [Colwellia hornerae]|uniref:NADH-quinone oxidoreductase subunit A n=1 Tax=Colwellia hornerae TaxID=89402 RepID=A0A5C6QNB3_9GAMM|nr:NADH-quinone oxidoreductase subunit A [Colwellia hornerae]TWX56282.1 NADH-quinone oxidoreductase subunit A [Colwellia hornerae]TWX62133.1 NADH-quinone oxidoreductase subunit A [Colwellia hornerae]TWX70535.1 NADH-quinone oxidoreductase subunit A [Colwellia hornerae]
MYSSEQFAEIWPIAAYFIILVIMLIAMLLLSHVLGPKTASRAKNTPYESGIIAAVTSKSSSTTNNHTRFTNHFFLYAVFFVIFDLETIYLFAWVIAFDEVGWAGFIEASIFISVLLAALLYIIRIGALELKHRHLPFRHQQTAEYLRKN